MFELVAESVGKHIIGSLVKRSGQFLSESSGRIAIIAQSGTYLRYSRIRVSCSELLRLHRNERFVLVRNAKRPEQFGPIGGVVRRYAAEGVDEDLYLKFGFESETAEGEEKYDLRGFLTGRKLRSFLVWYEKEENRERTCMHRELREEMAECSIDLAIPPNIGFRTVKTVYEGPFFDARTGRHQFRHFRVVEPDMRPEGSRLFWQNFAAMIEGNPSITWATSREIQAGRTRSGERIGNHACFLFQNRRMGDEPPAFRKVSNVS